MHQASPAWCWHVELLCLGFLAVHGRALLPDRVRLLRSYCLDHGYCSTKEGGKAIIGGSAPPPLALPAEPPLSPLASLGQPLAILVRGCPYNIGERRGLPPEAYQEAHPIGTEGTGFHASQEDTRLIGDMLENVEEKEARIGEGWPFRLIVYG